MIFIPQEVSFRWKKSKRIRWIGQVACRGENKNVGKILVGKSKGKTPLGSARHRW
jgi:hypothetical protein